MECVRLKGRKACEGCTQRKVGCSFTRSAKRRKVGDGKEERKGNAVEGLKGKGRKQMILGMNSEEEDIVGELHWDVQVVAREVMVMVREVQNAVGTMATEMRRFQAETRKSIR